MGNQNIQEENEITARPDYGAEIAVIIREPLKTQFERKRAIHFMPLCMRASCALLAAIPRLPAVTVYCVKPPNRAPARLRRLSLYPTQLSHFLFSKRFLEVPIRSNDSPKVMLNRLDDLIATSFPYVYANDRLPIV